MFRITLEVLTKLTKVKLREGLTQEAGMPWGGNGGHERLTPGVFSFSYSPVPPGGYQRALSVRGQTQGPNWDNRYSWLLPFSTWLGLEPRGKGQ